MNYTSGRRIVGLLLAGAIWASLSVPVTGAVDEVVLQIISFTGDKATQFNMFPTRHLRESQMGAAVRIERGQARIELKYSKMRPAVLFGGDVISYVLWAVNPDGTPLNLGEVPVVNDDTSGKQQFSTSWTSFGLIVTLEAYAGVEKPSSLMVFWNDGVTNPPAAAEELFFGGFGETLDVEREDLQGVVSDRTKSIELIQAERLFRFAEAEKADHYAPGVFDRARARLREAMAESGGSAQKLARESYSASLEAIKLSIPRRRLDELRVEVAENRAEIERLNGRLTEEEARANRAEEMGEQLRNAKQATDEALVQMGREKDLLQEELRNLESTMLGLRGELQETRVEASRAEQRLQSALSQVSDTHESARGMIVNLPDILYDVGKASLKSEAKFALAKLAGILLIMQDLNLRIEGHTDSTGSSRVNLKLSQQRADSVSEFLSGQGI
ncbi:MAG TPA: OmpA family protein, partial [Acidobacteriota bacterium]|nr:OmpA family protein [Acidobacteriota bacterium]